jgi:hypothetical protein
MRVQRTSRMTPIGVLEPHASAERSRIHSKLLRYSGLMVTFRNLIAPPGVPPY